MFDLDVRAVRAMVYLDRHARGKALSQRLSGLVGTQNRESLMAAVIEADVMLSHKDFNPNERRDPRGRWTTGGGKFRTVDATANAMTDAILAWDRVSGRTGAPPREEIVGNWRRQLRGRLSKDRAAIQMVAQANAENASNVRWREVTRGLPVDLVVVTHEPDRTSQHATLLATHGEAAKRAGGTTAINEDAVKEVGLSGDKTPQDHPSATSGYGLAAVLRHEYGHSVDDALPRSVRQGILAAIPDPRHDLTYYAGERDNEVIPELLATITEPGYRAEDFPPTVREAGRRLLDAIENLRR